MNAKDKISFLIDSCKKSAQRFPHTLLITDDSSLSRKFACDIASTMNANLIVSDTETIKSPGDLAGVFTNLQTGDFFLIQDINSINKACLQYMFSALENFAIDLTIDSGPYARTVPVRLNEFTVIATAPSIVSLNRRLLGSFFCIIEGDEIKKLEEDYLCQIFSELNINISKEILEKISSIASQRKINIESAVKNLLNYMILLGVKGESLLTNEVIDSYLAFSGISNEDNVNTLSFSRQINSEVKREVWRRDKGQCILCESQERL